MPLNGCGENAPLTEQVANNSGGPVVPGEVVRIVANDAVGLSQADVAANAQGTVGVVLVGGVNGSQIVVLNRGKGVVLLEPGLVGVAAGQTLWISPNAAGRATNVKPIGAAEVVLCVGVIKDTTGITNPTGPNDLVVTDVDPDCEPKVAGLVGSTQCGRVDFANETTKAVLFPVAFPVGIEPAVVLTPIAQLGSTVTPNLDAAPTNTGFTIRMSTPYTGAVYWIACAD